MTTDLSVDIDSLEAELVRTEKTLQVEDLVQELVPLDPQDIENLKEQGPSSVKGNLLFMRAIHHTAALKLACGEKATEVARFLKITDTTISLLQKDPQFSALIESYRDQVVDQHHEAFTMISMASQEAVQAIYERLTGDGRDEIPLEALRRLFETLGDRSGHSPIRRSQSMHFDASGTMSNAALERVKELHGEDARYNVKGGQAPALEAGNKENTEDHGTASHTLEAEFTALESKTNGSLSERESI